MVDFQQYSASESLPGHTQRIAERKVIGLMIFHDTLFHVGPFERSIQKIAIGRKAAWNKAQTAAHLRTGEEAWMRRRICYHSGIDSLSARLRLMTVRDWKTKRLKSHHYCASQTL